ncbi:MAG: hypothetical protein WDM85_15385 [Caulobacteraceae bacterium]
MPALKHLPADAAPKAIAALLDSDGALILDDVIAPSEIAQVRAEIDPYVDATADGRDKFTGFQTTRTGALVARSPACRELVMHPGILAACDVFLKRACDRYQLHLTQVIRIKPGPAAPGAAPRPPGLGRLPQRGRAAAEHHLGADGFHPGQRRHAGRSGQSRLAGRPQGRAPGNRLCRDEGRIGAGLFRLGDPRWRREPNRRRPDRRQHHLLPGLAASGRRTSTSPARPPLPARSIRSCRRCWAIRWGSYALGYFSPPLPPGQAPEAVAAAVCAGRRDRAQLG